MKNGPFLRLSCKARKGLKYSDLCGLCPVKCETYLSGVREKMEGVIHAHETFFEQRKQWSKLQVK